LEPYWTNLERVESAAARLPGDWAEANGNQGLTRDLVVLIREGKSEEACDVAVRGLIDGTGQAGAIWDAVHLTAGELVLSSKTHAEHRPVNSLALHANTAANALHHAFRESANRDTRLLLTLQAVAWMNLHRQGIVSSKHLVDPVDIIELTGATLPDKPEAAIDEILSTRTAKPKDASRLAFAFAQHHQVDALLSAARSLLPSKSSGDPHDIKFPVAIFEDLGLVSPPWRPHMSAAAVYSFWGSERPDLPVIQEVREAVRML
jgi:hypothetical protein